MKRRFAGIAASALFEKINRFSKNRTTGENAFVLTSFKRRFDGRGAKTFDVGGAVLYNETRRSAANVVLVGFADFIGFVDLAFGF